MRGCLIFGQALDDDDPWMDHVHSQLQRGMDRIADALGVELDPIMKQLPAAAPEGEALKEFAAHERTR